jgi:predicted naringenin-chalcone synthase
VPADWYLTPHSFVDKTEEYIHSCDSLGVAAVNDCLNPLQMSSDQIDYIIVVLTTGFGYSVHRCPFDQLTENACQRPSHPDMGAGLRWGCGGAVSVLFVLAEHLKKYPLRSGNYGLISALGPGFCAESLLVRF